jgi:uncharacterized repeat protein (TIGR01451 family)
MSDDTAGPAAGADGESRYTRRWRGLGGATLAAGAVGLFARRPGLLLASAVGIALFAYARTVDAPPATLRLSRDVSDPDPAAGDRVTVTVRIENTGRRPIPGLRVADGVPPGWTVVDGAATHATALWPGSATTFEYAVTVGAGQGEFDPATVLLRDPAGVVERRTTVEAANDGRSTLPATAADAPSLPAPVTRLGGREAVDASGEGVAFRAIREYRRGDPLSRIDWRRRARTGELATVEFQAERRLTVVLVVDARPAARLAPDPAAPTAVQRSAEAAERLYASLTGADHRVGIATLGPTRAWLAPGRGDAHRRQAHDRLSASVTAARSDGGANEGGGEGADHGGWLRQRLPERATVVLLTPACDEGVAGLARRLDAGGHPTAVVSPDPTTGGTAGRRLARIERRHRLRGLRAAGLPVLDWAPETDVTTAMAEAGWLS